MVKPPASIIEPDYLKFGNVHDLMLAMPIKDDFCRAYGRYVATGEQTKSLDGTFHTCIATETWSAAEPER